ncbi:MAG: sigma-70 family RNA polymerase sigma factor [Gemmatimonadota bacterium]
MTVMPGRQEDSDSTLVAAYRGGDQRAATVLVARHAPPVGRFLYSSGAGGGEVEDLVQETFFRAFRRIDSWREEASFRTWLFTIAGNLLKDAYRKNRGHKLLSIEERDFPDHHDPHTELAASETEQQLRTGLEKLPRLQREVFLMRVQLGTGYDEIAVALGTTPGAARVHYHHAVKRLKEFVA